ncbi:DUF2637 domain-containing protein [Streptomyces sp. NPDC054933]
MARRTNSRRRPKPKRQATPPLRLADPINPAETSDEAQVGKPSRPQANGHLADTRDRAADVVAVAEENAAALQERADTARVEAEQLLADADKRAAELIAQAERQSQQMLDKADADVQQQMAEASQQADALVKQAGEQANALRSEGEQTRTEGDQHCAAAKAEAEQLCATANREAERIRTEARRQAARTRADAASTARKRREEANSQVRVMLDNAKARAEELVAEAERIRARARTEAEQLLQSTQAEADRTRRTAQADADRAKDEACGIREEAEQNRAAANDDAAEIRTQAAADAKRIRENADREAQQFGQDAAEAAWRTRESARREADRVLSEAQETAVADRKRIEQLLADATERDAQSVKKNQDAEAMLAQAQRTLEQATSKTVQRLRNKQLKQDAREARKKKRDEDKEQARQARSHEGVPPLSGSERVLLVVGVLAATTVSALGLLSSYTALEKSATAWGWSWPWLLPVGIDVSIPAFTVIGLLLIRTNMHLRWVLWVPRALTGATVYLNWQAAHGLAGQIGHACLILLWVVFSEVGSHVYASRIGAVTGRRMETIRRSRWLLAPISTAVIRRRMILWEITSYAEALERQRAYTLARAEMRERWGRRWRWDAPLRERTLLRMGELLPATIAPALTITSAEPEHPAVGDTPPDSERLALTSDAHAPAVGAHLGERPDSDDAHLGAHDAGDDERDANGARAHRFLFGRRRSDTQALTERRTARVRALFDELGRRPEWTEIRDALTEANLCDTPVSRPTAQRLRAHVEKNNPALAERYSAQQERPNTPALTNS